MNIRFTHWFGMLFGTAPSTKVVKLCNSIQNLYSISNENVMVIRLTELPGNSKKEIIRMAEEFLRNNFQKEGYTIQKNDKEKGELVIKGTFPAFYSKKASGGSGLYCGIEYVLKVEAKDGKMRSSITLHSYNNEMYHNVRVNTVYPVEIKTQHRQIIGSRYVMTSSLNEVKISKNRSGKYFYAAVTTAYQRLQDMEKAMKAVAPEW